MKHLRSALALAGALALVGCATAPAADDAATASPPPRWYAPLPHGGTLADLRQWWQQLNDPLLIELIDAAQTVSPDVASAGARIAQARATRVAAASTLLPAVDANASASRSNTQAGVGGGGLVTIVQAGVQASWELDLFGGRKADVRGASARLDAALAGWHAARVSMAAETANTYVSLRTCERQLVVARNDARSRAESARLNELSARAGFTAPAVAALARASAAEASARATQQGAQCDTEIKALVALTGFAEPALRERLAAPWAEPEHFALPAVPPMPAQLLLQRPDVWQAERALVAARADVDVARADRLPRVTLAGQLGHAWIRAGGSTASENALSIGPISVTVPVFDAGRRVANEDAARARVEEATALFAASVRRAVQEVEQALIGLESARERSEDARIATEGYRASFAATEARYRSGLASLIELEDQRRAALAAETALVGLQRERLAAWIALYRALGGGWARPDTAAGLQP